MQCYFNILNPNDTITSLVIGTTEITNMTVSTAVSTYPEILYIVYNEAGIPVLIAEIGTNPVPTTWMKQTGTNIEFGVEGVVGGQPTTPPWLKPKP